jgi:S-DNA-T family DNA segregation ATPase FtsK/SpoIIIE
MSTNIKRRVSERTRAPKKTYSKLITIGNDGWLDEVFSLGCIAISLFLLVALLSYQYNTGLYTDLSVEDYPRKNLMGPVGNLIASMLLNNMGWCAFVSVFWLAWLSWYFWNYDKKGRDFKISTALIFGGGVFLILLFSCVMGSLFGGPAFGGFLGTAISRPLLRLFNFWGAFLCSLVGLYLSLAVVSKISVTDLVTRSTWIAFVEFPKIILNSTLLGIQIVLVLIGMGWQAIMRICGFENFASSESEVIPVPRPRRRTNDIKPAIELDEIVEEAAPEDYSHVVVSRKRSDFKLKAAESKSLRKRVEKIKESHEAMIQEYIRPDISFMTKSEENFVSEDDDELIKTSKQIEAKLKDFNILGRVTEVHPGPVITLYEFEPAPGVKVGRISALQDDLAMSLKATSIRIIAPIPKRGTVGIEVPNRNRELVRLRDILESEAFIQAESILSVAIGKDTYGDPVVVDIAAMPHLLMAGTTGTGKSVCINATLLSLLYRCTPAELGLIMIDPKVLELSVYEGIPHLKVPVVTNARQAKAVLDWAVKEMDRRYRVMQKYGVRSIDGYNKIARGEVEPDTKQKNETEKPQQELNLVSSVDEDIAECPPLDSDATITKEQAELLMAEKLELLPKIVIVIDELADLMLAVGRDIEELVTRLAQKARAAGIHLIVATQRPSVDVITGLIKANFPARISFRVSSRIDSRTILDSMGAEKLLGRGDMLFQAPGSVHLRRVHGAFVDDKEVKKVIEFLKKNSKPFYDEKIMRVCEEALEEEKSGGVDGEGFPDGEYDSFYDKAVEMVVQKGQASTSMIQRAFRIGYNRAARIIEMMEKEGIIGPMDGVKPRDVLIQNQEGPE